MGLMKTSIALSRIHLLILTSVVSLAITGCGNKKPDEPKTAAANQAKSPAKKYFFDLNDPNHRIIEAAVCKAADRASGELTEADLRGVQFLDLSRQELTDIAPLAQLTGLQDLRIGFNRIGNLWPLAKLTGLTRLHVNNNRLSDLQPLQGLTNLKILLAGGNFIKDLSPLMELKQLDTVLLMYMQPLTRAEVAKLKQVLPRCDIRHNAQR